MAGCRWERSARDLAQATSPSHVAHLVAELGHTTAAPVPGTLTRGEAGSWAQSLPRVAAVLARAGLFEVRVLLEYNPYQAGRARADVILAGVGPSERDTYVVVELKQWSACVLDSEDGRVRGTGAAYESPEGLQDPYAQASDYAHFIRNYTDGLHDEQAVLIVPVAYLHNASKTSVSTLMTADWQGERHVYAGDSESEAAFVRQLQSWFVASGDHEAVARRLLEAGYKQAPALLEAAGEILTDPRRYPLSAEQEEIYAKILHDINEASSPEAEKSQAVIVIKGGPGTGKTWLAMHLLGANARAGRQVSYATNSSSLRTALAKQAKQGLKVLGRPVDALITSARTYWDSNRWIKPLDVLIVDEAHRTATYTVRTGHANAKAVQADLEARSITQLFELKKSTKTLVALIDEDQSITPKDDCGVVDLRAIAKRTGASYSEFTLNEQHRSGGSNAYEAWVDALLAGKPTVWRDEQNYNVALAHTPHELEQLLCDPEAPGAAAGARLLAGFCWTWQKWPASASGISDIPFDIEIGTWRKRWNLRHSIDGYPKDSSWASTESGKEQVGSVFTAQGFEFGRCGVIIGPDFRWDSDTQQWIIDISQTRYGALATAAHRNADHEALIRNHYRVLLTRAMRETVVYSTDAPTAAKLSEIINP